MNGIYGIESRWPAPIVGSISRPFGTFGVRMRFPALKRRARLVLSLRDREDANLRGIDKFYQVEIVQ
jgi:hypothetical protein